MSSLKSASTIMVIWTSPGVSSTLLLPLAFGAWGLALIMTAIWGSVLYYKISLEDAALASRREAAKDNSPG